jgi:hypothetical protein
MTQQKEIRLSCLLKLKSSFQAMLRTYGTCVYIQTSGRASRPSLVCLSGSCPGRDYDEIASPLGTRPGMGWPGTVMARRIRIRLHIVMRWMGTVSLPPLLLAGAV